MGGVGDGFGFEFVCEFFQCQVVLDVGCGGVLMIVLLMVDGIGDQVWYVFVLGWVVQLQQDQVVGVGIGVVYELLLVIVFFIGEVYVCVLEVQVGMQDLVCLFQFFVVIGDGRDVLQDVDLVQQV